ncbi:MAG TPA: hypothetical protein VG387_16040 [Rhizomicrobium sp.]|jgi:hypothetical protein|nr:hypothetical protein [Rhizomicrobium sp.]
MSLACLVLAFGLCFDGKHVTVESEQFPLGRALTATAERYRVETAATDVFEMHDFRKSPKACADDVCIRYHKHCAPAAKGIVCGYRLVWPGILPDGLVTITADGDAALGAAEHEVSLVVEQGGRTAKLPFALMTVRSKDEAPPACRNGAYDACDPP